MVIYRNIHYIARKRSRREPWQPAPEHIGSPGRQGTKEKYKTRENPISLYSPCMAFVGVFAYIYIGEV